MDLNTSLKRAHIDLMEHPDTRIYAGIFLLGKSSIEEDPSKCPTAYTDGVNKIYGARFMEKLTPQEMRGIVVHENLHVALKHVARGKKLFNEDPQLTNMAADYVVNAMIMDMDQKFIQLPEGGLYDKMFHNWSFYDVYKHLKKEKEEEESDKPQQGQGKPCQGQQGQGQQGQGTGTSGKKFSDRLKSGSPLDEHDFNGPQEQGSQMDEQQLSDIIDKALQQSALLAGLNGMNVPRAVREALAQEVDWREPMRNFMLAITNGRDDFSWRRYNRKKMVDDIYLPSNYTESIDEVLVAIDTSGSIDEVALSEFAQHVGAMCEQIKPKILRVLWWDTDVRREQIIEEDYTNLRSKLTPAGGGGTAASCVSKYIVENRLSPDCIVVLTDGYVESEVRWDTNAPTLWLVTQNPTFNPPKGQMVKYNR